MKMNMKINIAEEIRSMINTGRVVKASPTENAIGDTPYAIGESFIVANIKFQCDEIQVISEDGWAFEMDEVEFNV